MSKARTAASYELHQSPFYRLRNQRKLAALLKVGYRELVALAGCETNYSEWDDKSPSGKVRRIEKPHDRLDRIQKRVANLLSRITIPAFLHCPGKGKSYVTNADQHVDGREVRCLDVKSYFSSTPSRRVFWFFHQVMECSRDVAGILTSLATHKDHLPTGSSLSPVMSFYVHLDMWWKVSALADAAGCTVTVYMDDITISGPQVTDRLMWEIKKAIHVNGLNYHKAKNYSGRDACEITGVIVDNGRLKLPHRQHKKMHELRQDLRCVRDEMEREILSRKLQGRLAQASQILAKNDARAA